MLLIEFHLIAMILQSSLLQYRNALHYVVNQKKLLAFYKIE